MVSRITIPAFAAVLLCSCSLKEDRRDCPCLLTVITELPDSPHHILEYQLREPDGSEFSFRKNCDSDADTVGLSLKRGMVRIGAVLSGKRQSSSDILIPYGSQADLIYATETELLCDDEEAGTFLQLNKQFAFLDLTITGLGDDDRPDKLAVNGNVCGWGRDGITPKFGPFYHEEQPDCRNKVLFVLPRQMDNSLTLVFFDKGDNEETVSCPIGEEISSRGFDWNSNSLKDIRMHVQYTEAAFEIVSCEWVDSPVINIGI